MKRCEDCIHDGICNEWAIESGIPFVNADLCEHYQNKEGYRKQSEGRWFILEYEYFTCSECGYYHPNGCDSTKEAKEKLADGKVPQYCSKCGAKMKGGDQE